MDYVGFEPTTSAMPMLIQFSTHYPEIHRRERRTLHRSNPTRSILSLRLRNCSSGSRRNSKNNSDTSIKDSHSNFLRKKDNAEGLVRLLKTIEAAGKDGISTIELCEQAFKTRNYGMRVINRAYDEGYIKRFGKNKHSPKKINYLSDKGIEQLSQLQQHEEEE